jgi:hypothetical protein
MQPTIRPIQGDKLGLQLAIAVSQLATIVIWPTIAAM